MFNIYMAPLTQLVQNFRLGFHQYTDDTWLYLLMGSWLDTTPVNLATGLEAVVGFIYSFIVSVYTLPNP